MQENKVEINKINSISAQDKKISKKINIFEKISYFSLLFTIFLLPLLFVPSKFVDFDSAKGLLVVFGVLISLIFWCVARIKDGKFETARSYFFPSALLAVFIYLLSAIFSGNKLVSLIGRGFELGTFGFVAVCFIMMFLSASVVKTKRQIIYPYFVLFFSFFIISLFQGLRLLFGADFLSAGYFIDVSSNTIGKWNELSIYFGLALILSTAFLGLATLKKSVRYFLYFIVAVSIFFISIVNFSGNWYVIAIFSILSVIYKVFFSKLESGEKNASKNGRFLKRIPYLALIIFIILSVFIVDGIRAKAVKSDGSRNKYLISESIANYFNIAQMEVRPSPRGTFDIFKSALKENPVLGSGPNRFINSWLQFKSVGINNTPFWNINFNYGIGTIPTIITTTGALGLISWIVFILLFLSIGFKYVFSRIEDKTSRYLLTSSFFASLYLWIMNSIYATGIMFFFLAFFFSGLFIAILAHEKLISVKTFSYSGNPRRSFVFAPLLILVIISSITAGYIYYQKFLSSIYFLKAVDSANSNGGLADGEKYAVKSLSYSKTDSQYRLLSDIYIAKLASLASQKSVTADIFNKELAPLFKGAVDNSNSALAYDSANFQNYISLGRVYESIIPIDGAYASANQNYLTALKLNPTSPEIYLMLARIEFLNKNNAKAREYLATAIQMKNDYTDAAFLLAQIEVKEGNIKEAIKIMEVVSRVLYNNPVVQFQLGVLKYSDKEKDYKGAAEAFERAVALDASYSNARYFLGLSYFNLGRSADAINQFEIARSLNPDNKDIASILQNLKEGKAPFAIEAPIIGDKLEKKSSETKSSGTKPTKTKKK